VSASLGQNGRGQKALDQKVFNMAISLSAGVRAALSSLQDTSALAQVTQNRLATGRKVNSALDNPASFFLSQGLSSRANDLTRLLDDQTQGTKTLEAADKGISAITKLVESTKAAAQAALQSTEELVNVTSTDTYTTTTNITTALGTDFAANDTISVNGTVVFTVAANDTVGEVIDAINNNTTVNPTVRASLDTDGHLVIESLDGSALTVASSNAAALTSLIGAGVDLTPDADVNTTRQSAAAQYDALRTQINQLAGDASYNGVNLLNGDDLQILFNEQGTSSITIAGVTFDANGLGISATANDFQSNAEINAAIDELSAAATTLRSQASTFGSNLSVVNIRQEFTEGLISTLQTGADSLVLADLNEEGANLLALNTRQQLSQTALALSAQSEQAILQLF
jgi:flagellin